MTISPYGEDALLIQFEQLISKEVFKKVRKLTLSVRSIKGVVAIIPAYASLLIRYDPLVLTDGMLRDKISDVDLLTHEEDTVAATHWRLPVCYDAEHALDDGHAVDQLSLSFEEIVGLHTSQHYDVYMIGFQPGFGYMGVLPEKIQINRLEQPRKSVPQGSVGLAHQQTGIYPANSPGGWVIIGRCPIHMFDPLRNQSSLLQMGDTIRFYPITKTEFLSMESSSIDIKSLYA